MERDELMHRTRAAKCAVDAGVTDELTGFMAIFHPEVDMFSPRMISAKADARKKQKGY